jgi:hypothetical protein
VYTKERKLFKCFISVYKKEHKLFECLPSTFEKPHNNIECLYRVSPTKRIATPHFLDECRPTGCTRKNNRGAPATWPHRLCRLVAGATHCIEGFFAEYLGLGYSTNSHGLHRYNSLCRVTLGKEALFLLIFYCTFCFFDKENILILRRYQLHLVPATTQC